MLDITVLLNSVSKNTTFLMDKSSYLIDSVLQVLPPPASTLLLNASSLASSGSTTALVVVSSSLLLWYYWDAPFGSTSRPSSPFMSKKKGTRAVRAPGYIPVLGHAITGLRNIKRLNDFFHECFLKNNDSTMMVQFPRQPTFIVFNDPKNVEHVLKTKFEIYDKGPYFNARVHDVLGGGIFNADGDSWKRQRKLAANIFNVRNFKEFVHLDTMASPTPIPFAASFDAAQERLEHRFINPFWDYEERLTSIRTTHAQNVKTIREFGLGIVRDRKKEMTEEGWKDRCDILSLFMRDDPHADEETLCRDTTAQALSWSIYELFHAPNHLQSLIDELDSLLGPLNHPDSREYPTYEEVKTKMPFANAVFKEALRLHPSVPKESKQANRDDVLPDGTEVKSGMLVLWSPYAMGRSKKIWGPTATVFNPTRWLEMTHQPSPFDYPVFNAGPRVCLGKSLAELEGVFVLAAIVRRFKFEGVGEVSYGNSLTLPMKGGLRCRVSERL
ncbi:hypothetical protein HDU67_003042 [Dinochytrium kinnereticum]|nr:hypothetical protein HDU67_003042 [Dinochytrium kinnereticum]